MMLHCALTIHHCALMCSPPWDQNASGICDASSSPRSRGEEDRAPLPGNRFPPEVKLRRRRETPVVTLCRTSFVLFTDVQKICAIWLEAWSFPIPVKEKILESKRVWGALSLRLGRSLFRSGFRFHFLGFWVCSLLFTHFMAIS